jgi:hypothetical protein
MKILLLEARLEGFRRLKYGEGSYTFKTLGELTSEAFTLSDRYFQQSGHLAFKMDEFKGDEMPDENTQIKGEITPSQYLRSRLFAKHMAKGGSKDTFPEYYKNAIYGFAQAVDDSYEDKRNDGR